MGYSYSSRVPEKILPIERKIMAQMHSNTDWDSVTIIGKKATTSKQAKSSTALNSAARSGTGIISEKKTGLNQKKTNEGSRIAKVDRMTDVSRAK